MKTLQPLHGTYDDIADEYYDAGRHPTCANFFELSRAYIVNHLGADTLANKTILEVGCGRSIVAPMLSGREKRLENLTLLDASPRMLHHSKNWEAYGAKLVVADARNTGLPSLHFDIIVSSLGDPYNVLDFWAEIERVLSSDGFCLFTTPAQEWASRFRPRGELNRAEFLRADGTVIHMPSEIPPIDEQARILRSRNLRITQEQSFPANSLSQPPSPKLLVTRGTAQAPIVRGFRIARSNQHA
jgi:SAM-dependent methyltransferase